MMFRALSAGGTFLERKLLCLLEPRASCPDRKSRRLTGIPATIQIAVHFPSRVHAHMYFNR